MPELELALRQLGAAIEFPEPPDLATRVRGRLGEAPGRGWAPHRLAAVALAVLVVAVAAVMAVPSARTAVLEWLGIKGVSVTRVSTLPETGLLRVGDLGTRVTLAEARQRAPWLVEPRSENVGRPDAVYYGDNVPGGQVTFVWGTTRKVRLLLTQSPGEVFAQKTLGPGTTAERADVDGKFGVWLSGAPHAFVYRDERGQIREETGRLVGNTLLWQDGDLTVRIEGDLSKDEALEIARSVR
jgi:hypothetical protein